MFPIVRWPYLQVRFVSFRKGISSGVQMIKHGGQRLQLLLQMYPSMEKRWIYHRPGFGYTHSLTQEMDVFLQFGKFMYQDNKRKIQASATSTTVHAVHLKKPPKSPECHKIDGLGNPNPISALEKPARWPMGRETKIGVPGGLNEG